MQARDDKENLINEAARIREEQEYNAMKQERDNAFYDLEGLKMDQEGQLEGLKADAEFWEGEKLIAILNNDMELFNEYEKSFQEAQKGYLAMEQKLQGTIALYEVEKAGKEQRDMDEAVKAATAEFEQRSGERKNQFDTAKGEFDTAAGDLQANLNEIETL